MHQGAMIENNHDVFSAIVNLEPAHASTCHHVAATASRPENRSPPSTKANSKDAASGDHIHLLNL